MITKRYLYVALIILVISVIFSKAILYDYVWDDNEHIRNNPLSESLSKENFQELVLNPSQNYMLIPQIFWGFLLNLSDDIETKSKILHLANIILHTLISILVFLIIKKFINNNFYSFLGALIFSLHPVQVESVAWISEFRGLLSAFWGFLLIYIYTLDKEKILIKNIIGSILFFLSIFSKPVGIVFLPIVIMIHTIIKKKKIWAIAPFIVYSAIFSLLLFKLMSMNSDIKNTTIFNPLWFRPFGFLDSITFYLSKIIYPVALYPTYGRAPNAIIYSSTPYIFSFLVILSIVGISLLKSQKKIIIFAISFFIIALLPTSGLISFIFQKWSTVADRYLYIPMFAISLMVSYFLSLKLRRKKIILILICCYILFLSSLTIFQQVNIWKESKTLWNHCILHNPNAKRAYFNLGANLFKQGKYSNALIYFDKALEKDIFYNKALIAKAKTHSKLGDTDNAIKDLRKISGRKSDEASVQMLYLIKAKEGLYQAIKFAENQFMITNNKPYYYLPLAHLYFENQQYWKSINYYLKDLTVNPKNTDNLIIISQTYTILKQDDFSKLYKQLYSKHGESRQ